MYYLDAIAGLVQDVETLFKPVDELVPESEDPDKLPNDEDFLRVFDRALLAKVPLG